MRPSFFGLLGELDDWWSWGRWFLWFEEGSVARVFWARLVGNSELSTLSR